MNAPDIIVTRRDLGRLDALLGETLLDRLGNVGSFLLHELARAKIVPDDDVPSDVVTLGRRVEFRDDASGRVMTLTLAYPHEAFDRDGFISVLTPVGAAVLGLSEGQSIAYETRDGRRKTLTVLSVTDGNDAGPTRASRRREIGELRTA